MKKQEIGWTTFSVLVRAVSQGERAISLQVVNAGKGWSVTAVEGSTASKSLSAIFDAHAHAIVTENEPSLMSAIGAAEQFIRKWKRSKSMAACECEPISKIVKRKK